MRTPRGWRRFFRLSESSKHREREVDDELRFHVEGLVERHIAQGMCEEEAWEVVMHRFDAYRATRTALIRGRDRGARLEGRRLFFDGLRQDLRVSWRQYAKHKAFATMAVLTLGLGIGASTTMFSVVNGVLLDPLPYPDSDRLVTVGSSRLGRQPGGISAPEFVALHGQSRTLESFAARLSASLAIQLNERPELLRFRGVTEDYFEVFRASPVLGRAFSQEDYRAGAAPVAILSHEAWLRYWQGNPGVLGTTIRISGDPSPMLPVGVTPTVVGVMSPGMDSRSNVWVPLRVAGSEYWEEEWQFGNFGLSSIGRLRPGSSFESAEAEAAGLASRLASEHPRFYSGRFFEDRTLGVVRLLDRTVGNYRTRILLLFGGAVLLLVIATANLTGLFLSRSLERRQELAVRAALGGSRSRIFRHLMTEIMSLALLGGGLGFLVAVGFLQVLQVFAPADLPRLDNLHPDLRVVAFTVAITVVAGLLCGLASLPSGSRGELGDSLRETDRTGHGRGSARLWSMLVSAQVALAVVLLVGAGLLSTSLSRLRQVDPGIEVEDLLVMPMRIPASYEAEEDQQAFLAEVVRRIRAVPGVESATWAPDPPLHGRAMTGLIQTEETLEEEAPPLMGVHPVGPDYFTTMGIPILLGRGLTARDNATSMPVAVIDETLASRLWPSGSAVGRQILINEEHWHTVVGVVGRVRQRLAVEVEPEVYVPAFQRFYFRFQMHVGVRTSLPAGEVAGAVRAAVWEVDPTVPVPVIQAMESRVSADLRNPRFLAILSSAFSLFAVVLTLGAIFGLMSYWVTARTREVGVRMALGARGEQVLRSVLWHCLRMALVGVAVGLVLAAAASRLLDALLFGVSALDPPTFALVAAGIGLASILACLVPAARATRIDPTTALRGE